MEMKQKQFSFIQDNLLEVNQNIPLCGDSPHFPFWCGTKPISKPRVDWGALLWGGVLHVVFQLFTCT